MMTSLLQSILNIYGSKYLLRKYFGYDLDGVKYLLGQCLDPNIYESKISKAYIYILYKYILGCIMPLGNIRGEAPKATSTVACIRLSFTDRRARPPMAASTWG